MGAPAPLELLHLALRGEQIDAQFRPWWSLLSLRAGLGRVLLASPDTRARLETALRLADSQGIACRILGSGTNLVGSDSDCPDLAIRLGGHFRDITRTGAEFQAGTGLSLLQFLTFAARQGYGGISALSGIPGTLGGAAAMNAGALGVEFGPHLTGLDGYALDGQRWEMHPSPQDWGYRQSPVPANVVVTAVTIRLKEVMPHEELGLIKSELHRRAKVTPQGHSAGSVFRNPSPERPAGLLLEQAGCKGLRRNNVLVSPQHANWLVVSGDNPATASDCRWLCEEMVRRVQENFGITLQSEWRWQ